MKIELFCLIIFIILFVSCKKESETNEQINPQITNTPSISEEERLAQATQLINKTNPSDDDLQNAQLILSKISTKSNNYAKAKKLLQKMEEKRKSNSKLTRPVEVIEIKIGMNISTFERLCGKPNDTSTYESARGTTITLKYEYNSKRGENDCWGTFTFRENQLDSIYRN